MSDGGLVNSSNMQDERSQRCFTGGILCPWRSPDDRNSARPIYRASYVMSGFIRVPVSKAGFCVSAAGVAEDDSDVLTAADARFSTALLRDLD